MPKTFPIRLEVEEIALGPVLRKLNEMPGIVKLHLDLEHGGQGAGRKQLEEAAKTARNGGSAEQQVIKLLMEGPKHVSELSRKLGGAKSRAYGAVHQLRKKGLAEAAEGKGMHQLSAKAREQLGGAVPALPAPTPSPVTHGPGGRATPGSGNIVLKTILSDGVKTPVEIRAKAAEHGMSPKSVSGVMVRAKRDGLIKKNGAGYELTAKGLKIETGAPAHG
jgi:Mn-dependent DtxR family transcriptional regulator